MKFPFITLCCILTTLLIGLTDTWAQCPAGQKQLTINVKTDNYPGETTWQLISFTSGAVLLSGGPYSTANNTYTTNICVPNNSTLQFTINDAYGDGICCAFGNGFYNIMSGSTTLSFGNSFAAQEIKIFAATPSSKDFIVKEISLLDNVYAGSNQVQGKLMNIGTTSVNNFSLYYRVNGGAIQTQTGISSTIAPGGEYSFTHSTPCLLNFGSNTLEVWASNLNGSADMNTDNDVKSKIITGLYELGDRTVLIEHFTQASCGPCAAQNPVLQTVLNNSANVGKYAHLSYHTSWPGFDPMYNQNTADPNARVTYYSISGVPSVVMEGVKKGGPSIVTTTQISQYKAIPALCNISIQESLSGNNITITATVIALTDLTSGNYKLHLTLIEQMVSYATAPGSNGEKNFPNVIRKLLPTNGTTLPALTMGQSFSTTQTYTIPSYIIASQLRTVAFVQENSSKVVLQTYKAPNASGTNSLASSASIDLMNATVNPSCSGSNLGSIALSLSGGASSLVNYQWSNGATSSTVTNLAPGTYTVSVYSANTNTFLKSHTYQVNSITSFTVTPTVVNSTCTTSNNGSIALTTSGGGGVYSYQWSTGQNTSSLANLSPGTYSVTVSNSNFPSCPYMQTFTITGATMPTVSVPTGQTLCSGSTATAINFSGTVPGTIFSWSNTNASIGLAPSGSGNISSFAVMNTGATPISATIAVTPIAAGCAGTPQTIVITVNPAPNVLPVTEQVLCSGINTSPITFNSLVSGSTYSWTNNNMGISLPATGSGNIPSFTALNAGTLPVVAVFSVVASANSCLGSPQTFNITVNPKPNPIAMASSDTTCLGAIVELSVVNGGNYIWSTGQSGATITVNPLASTTYTVTATNSYNCSNTTSVHVGVKQNPTATASSNNPCIGGTLILNSSGGIIYQWSGPNGFTSIVQNPVVSTFATPALNGTYTVTVTDADACTGSASVIVSIVSGLIPTITSNSNFCANSSTVLSTGTTYYTYIWSNGASSSSITVNTGGIYSVTVSNSDGCIGSASIAITVFPTPIAVNGSNSPICTGNAISLNSSGGVSYFWSGPNGFSSNAQNPVLINATSAMNGTYLVTVTNAQGCSNSALTSVQVQQLPTATAGSNSPCIGSTFTLNASGGSGYSWTGPNGFASTISNPTVSTTATIDINGVYTVTVSNSAGCTASASVIVQLSSNLTPAISGESVLCQGSSTSLNAGSGYNSYTWSTGANGSTITVASSGTYTVTVSSASGCTGSASKTVVVNPSPTATANSNSPVCTGSLLNFSSSGGFNYAWSGPNSFSSTQQYPVISNASISMSGNYVVTVTNNFSCSSSASTSVNVQAPPTATASANNPCLGGNFTLTSSGGAIYLWSGPNSFTSNQQNPTVSNNATSALNGVYSVTVSSTAGCSSVASVNVTITNVLNPVITGNSTICQGSSTILSAGTGYSSYLWSNGATTANISINAAGTYSVTVTNNLGCVGTTSKTVTVNAAPLAAANNNSPVCSGSTLNLSGSGGSNYSWNGPNGFTSTQQNPSFSNSSANLIGIYTVTVTNTQGCTATATTSVQVVTPPNAGTNNSATVCNDNTEGVSSINLNTLVTGISGGIFSPVGGAPALVGGNTFNAQGLVPNVYQYSYTLVNPAPCPNSSVTFSITAEDCIFCASPPSANFSYGNNAFCTDGGIISPTVSAGSSSGLWTAQSGLTINSVNGSINLSSSIPGTYTILNTVAANGPCPEVSYNVFITITNPPTANAGNNQTICIGQSAVLSASGGATYLWSTGQSGSIITVNPTTTTTYLVTVTNANSCTSTDAVTVNVSELPVADAGSDQSVCIGQSTALTASGGTTYVWSNGQTGANISVSPATMTTYTVIVTASNGCSSSDAVTVSVNNPPNANAGIDQFVCPGQSVTFDATGGTAYTWNTGQTGSVISVNPVVTSTYTVTVTNNNGCSEADAVTVSILAPPIANAGANQSVCLGQSAILSASGGNSYLWNTGQTGSAITVNPTTTTTYTVTVTDNLSCTASDATLVTITTPEFTVSGLTGPAPLLVCLNESSYTVSFAVNGGIPPYFVNGVQLPGSTNIFNSSVIYSSSYSFTISDNTGCIFLLQGMSTCSAGCLIPIEIQSVNDNGGCIDGFTLVPASPTNPLPVTNLYSIDGVNFQSQPTFTNLNAETYDIYVSTECGVWNIGTYSMPSTTMQVVATVTMQTNGTYLASASVTGGTPLYTYLWSNGATGNTAYFTSFIEPISVTVTDKNGCQQSYTLMPSFIVGLAPNDGSFQTSFYPNPSTSGLFFIDLPPSLTLLQPVTVAVYDITGRLLENMLLPISRGIHLYELDLQKFNSGVYPIHLQVGNIRMVKKAIVIK